MNLTIVLPCFNEEKNIGSVVSDVDKWMRSAKVDGTIIVVDDGSKDGTAAVLLGLQEKIQRLMIVTHERNRGYGAAVRSGCDAAQTEYIGYMDSDGQFKAEDFSLLLSHLKNVDFVTGRRRHRADPLMRKVNAKLFAFLNAVVLGIWVHDINCAMKVYTKEVWRKVRPAHATGALINAEIFYNLKKLGIPWHQVDVRHYPRVHGSQTGANLKVIFRMFRELLRLRFAR